jgi:hypothetical protein
MVGQNSYQRLQSARLADAPLSAQFRRRARILRGRNQVWIAASAAMIFGASACSGQSSTDPTVQSPPTAATSAAAETTPTTAEAATPSNGPIVLTCRWQDPADTDTTVARLNLDTGDVVSIAEFPTGGCDARVTRDDRYLNRDNFGQQSLSIAYSPDFTKRVIDTGKNYHVGYYDSEKQRVVDVTEIIEPATGDFDRDPMHHTPIFTPDGLFRFYDGHAQEFKYYDPAREAVTKTLPYPDGGAPWIAPVVTADEPPFIANTQVQGEPGEFRTCLGLWAIDASRYLRVSQVEGSSGSAFLSMDQIPSATGECEREGGKNITPEFPDYSGPHSAAASPQGEIILFTMTGKDNTPKLYRADVSNPSNPTEVQVAGGLERGYAFTIVAWD